MRKSSIKRARNAFIAISIGRVGRPNSLRYRRRRRVRDKLRIASKPATSVHNDDTACAGGKLPRSGLVQLR